MLKSNKNLLFQRLYQEPAVVKNNLSYGIKCHQGSKTDDFKHIDIIYESGETEDCKYCGQKGVFLTEGVIKSNTTWISSIIDNIDYKVKREKIFKKYKDKLIFDETQKESYIYINKDDFKKLADKQLKLIDESLDWYNTGKMMNYFQGKKSDAEVSEQLEIYAKTHNF